METRRYTLPLTGTMHDWATLSGDSDDPVRAVGVTELARGFAWPAGIAEHERQVTTTLVSVDMDAGAALVEVEAHPAFHAALTAALAGKPPSEVAAAHGRLHLMRPKGAPTPRVSLRFRV